MTGLDSPTLTIALVIVALTIFLWGFERYRTSFSRAEFGVAILLSLGVFTIALFPDVFVRIGSLLDIQSRPLTIALVVNVALIALVLYLFARTRSNQLQVAGLSRSLTIEQATIDAGTDERRIFVVIPAYNEAGSIRGVVSSLPKSIRGYAVEPLVVSDGSTDDTYDRTDSTDAIVVEHPINQGQGGALKTGFEIARRNGADMVVTMDADGQHPVDQLEDLVAPILENRADYVVGSRYIGSDQSGNGIARQSGIKVFTALINAIAKMEITDCTNGFRAIRGPMLDELRLTEMRFSAPELLIEARKNGLRIEEIPVTIARRETGETKKPKLGYAVGLIRTILVTWIR
ncbi:DUF2304 family protein [Haladaptatus sp. CMAA 1911]|uniref:DUF2304 family protein n=1 Tax=unclassified Haladaptatus TaxID=2622732 RepID=UPI003754A9BC